jgi:hypothetical protein
LGYFRSSARRQGHVAETFWQIALILAAHVAEMRRQARLHAIGEHRSTVLLPLTTPDDDLMAVEIEVLDT